MRDSNYFFLKTKLPRASQLRCSSGGFRPS